MTHEASAIEQIAGTAAYSTAMIDALVATLIEAGAIEPAHLREQVDRELMQAEARGAAPECEAGQARSLEASRAILRDQVARLDRAAKVMANQPPAQPVPAAVVHHDMPELRGKMIAVGSLVDALFVALIAKAVFSLQDVADLVDQLQTLNRLLCEEAGDHPIAIAMRDAAIGRLNVTASHLDAMRRGMAEAAASDDAR